MSGVRDPHVVVAVDLEVAEARKRVGVTIRIGGDGLFPRLAIQAVSCRSGTGAVGLALYVSLPVTHGLPWATIALLLGLGQAVAAAIEPRGWLRYKDRVGARGSKRRGFVDQRRRVR
jgi:hypothetical protein